MGEPEREAEVPAAEVTEVIEAPPKEPEAPAEEAPVEVPPEPEVPPEVEVPAEPPVEVPPEEPTTLYAMDLQQLHQQLERTSRLEAMVQIATSNLVLAKDNLLAAQEQEALFKEALRTNYKLSPADTVDLATGTITKDAKVDLTEKPKE